MSETKKEQLDKRMKKKDKTTNQMGIPLLHLEVEVNPTEDPEKVKSAVRNIFGDVELKGEFKNQRRVLRAKTMGLNGLGKLRDLLRRERIRDAARGVFFGGLDRKILVFYLNKQAAYAGHISFSRLEAGSPLGPIKVNVKCDKPQLLIDWLAPKTT